MPPEAIRKTQRTASAQGESAMNLQRAASTPRVGEVVAPKGAAHLCLERGVDGQLWAQLGEKRCAVWVSRCFPWSEPGRFISLRDEEEDEFALVRNPQQLDEGSRVALESSLVEAGFVLEIIGVEACEEEVEIRTWVVRTKQGRRSFQTRRDEWPRDVPGGGLLINDVSGDLFYVRDPAGLDPASRALLWAFVD